MRKIVFLLSIVFLSSNVIAQSFEGILKVDFRDQTTQSFLQTEWVFKGDQMTVRLPLKQPSGEITWTTFLPQFEKNNLLIITEQPYKDASGFYYEFPIDLIQSAFPDEYLIAKATSATKEFEGFQLSEYLISSTQANSEIWFSEDLDIRSDLLKQFFKGSRAIQAIPDGKGGMFPFISRTRDAEGKIIEEIRVREVIRTKIDDSQFTIPEGVKSAAALR